MWVDENGNVYFADSPPTSREYERFDAYQEPSVSEEQREQERQRASEKLDRLQKEQEERRALRLKKQEQRRAEQEARRQEEAVRKQRCGLARKNLETLRIGRPVYWTTNEGERIFLDSTQRLLEIKRAAAEVKEFCN